MELPNQSDHFQMISPAASPEILNHTVLERKMIKIKNERLYYLTTSLICISL